MIIYTKVPEQILKINSSVQKPTTPLLGGNRDENKPSIKSPRRAAFENPR